MPTTKQIRLLYTAKRVLQLSDDEFREIIGADSVKKLSARDVRNAIKVLVKQGFNVTSELPYEHLKGRESFKATPAQLRLIETLWAKQSNEGKVGLMRYVAWLFGPRDGKVRYRDVLTLDRYEAWRVIESLKALLRKKNIPHTCGGGPGGVNDVR